MPIFERGEVRLGYEVHGDSFPVLAIAPGGSRSRIAVWDRAPDHPVRALAGHHGVITMDQRNAGASWAPLRAGDGWATYTDVHLALLDRLGVALSRLRDAHRRRVHHEPGPTRARVPCRRGLAPADRPRRQSPRLP